MSYRAFLLTALAASTLMSFATCDEERIITRSKTRASSTTEKPESSTSQSVDHLTGEDRENIIRDYFELQGIDIASKFEHFDRYNSEVVAKMQDLLANQNNFMKVFHENREINSMIHEAITKQVEKAEPPISLADEATLQALDLIVPNSESQKIFELAKDDLRQFYGEQPDRARELLERIQILLDSDELSTMDAMTHLEGFYYQWIPLVRLAEHIESHGQSDGSPSSPTSPPAAPASSHRGAHDVEV